MLFSFNKLKEVCGFGMLFSFNIKLGFENLKKKNRKATFSSQQEIAETNVTKVMSWTKMRSFPRSTCPTDLETMTSSKILPTLVHPKVEDMLQLH